MKKEHSHVDTDDVALYFLVAAAANCRSWLYQLVSECNSLEGRSRHVDILAHIIITAIMVIIIIIIIVDIIIIIITSLGMQFGGTPLEPPPVDL